MDGHVRGVPAGARRAVGRSTDRLLSDVLPAGCDTPGAGRSTRCDGRCRAHPPHHPPSPLRVRLRPSGVLRSACRCVVAPWITVVVRRRCWGSGTEDSDGRHLADVSHCLRHIRDVAHPDGGVRVCGLCVDVFSRCVHGVAGRHITTSVLETGEIFGYIYFS